MYTFSGRGLVFPDPHYLTEDRTATDNEIAAVGLQLDPSTVIDETVAGPPAGPAIDLGGTLPPVGSDVWLSGPRLGSWVRACSEDPDGDGSCDPDEADRSEIVVFDPATKHAIRAYVYDLPEFSAASMTGILRREERAVDNALGTRSLGFDDLDITVSDRYILDDAAPRHAPLIVCGLAGGYLVFRRSHGRLPRAARTLAPGDGIPLRISGMVRTPSGLEHVREAPGELVRFVLGLRTTLVVERTGYPHGVQLGAGSVGRLSSGLAMTFRAPRPSVRVVAETGPLILSFDTETDRDRAAAEVLDETGLGLDGKPVPTADGTPIPTAWRSDMDAWEYDDVEADRAAGDRPYHEFLRVPDLSAGIYVLEAGATDPQSPHSEDELYYVIAGRALMTVGVETRPVVPGSLVFVAAGDPHRFHDIAERLELLVAFGPAEGARARLP
jgi:mannose-6-phosphate isomerase-like protein (cupin superfamily)